MATTVLDRMNLSKTQTLTRAAATEYKKIGACKYHGLTPNGLRNDTRPNGPKDGGAALRQILDVTFLQ